VNRENKKNNIPERSLTATALLKFLFQKPDLKGPGIPYAFLPPSASPRFAFRYQTFIDKQKMFFYSFAQ
jgi:hypothetical protein